MHLVLVGRSAAGRRWPGGIAAPLSRGGGYRGGVGG